MQIGRQELLGDGVPFGQGHGDPLALGPGRPGRLLDPAVVQELVLCPVDGHVERLVGPSLDADRGLYGPTDVLGLPFRVHSGNVQVPGNLDELLLGQTGRLAVVDTQDAIQTHLYHVLQTRTEPLVISRDGHDVRLDVLANLKEVPDRLGDVTTSVRIGLDDRLATGREALGNLIKVRLLARPRPDVEPGPCGVPAVSAPVRDALVLLLLD